MERRSVLSGLGGLSAGAIGAPARARARFRYKIAHSSPPTHPFNRRLLEVASEIAQQSAGRMTLSVFPASELGGDNDLLTQVRLGAIEFAQPAGLILATVLPCAAINGIGFTFRDYRQVWSAMDGELGAYLRRRIERETDLVPMLRRWDLGFRQITNNMRPVSRPADLAGMKIRIPGAPAEVSLFQALGAYPVTMEFGEVYTSLQTGVVDGEENPLSVIAAARFSEVQRYCSISNHVWDGYWITANRAAWTALPDDLQQIVRTSFDAAAYRERRDLAQLDAGLQSSLSQQGLRLTRPDPEPFRARLREAGFYRMWRRRMGEEAWSLLEAYVGRLGE